MARINKSKGRKGAELIEFTLALLPLVAMVFVLMDVCWGLFVKGTLAYAVRQGARRGITITATDATNAGNSDLTTMVKQTVQDNALGMLGHSSADPGWSLIKVNYIQPPDYDSTAAPVDVSTQSYGDTPGNIMQVSIQGYTLTPLASRIFAWRKPVDGAATVINAVACDVIEPSRDVPPIGVAP